jgi:steroid 5-alpha reductase family enzyme
MTLSMIHWPIYLSGLISIVFFALAGWILSLARNNVNHIHSMWSLFIGMAAYSYSLFFFDLHARNIIIITLVTIWAIRASAYQTVRFWGKPEDHRHAALRQSQAPFFWFSSLYLVFGLHAILAWSITMTLFGGIQSATPLNHLDHLGVAIVVFGLLLQSSADWQLHQFKANPSNQGKVLTNGLWQYCRHPNYFGECCVWWGFYCIAYAAGAWWSIISPLLVTLLMSQCSREHNTINNAAAYSEYRRKTNPLFPWKPKV